VSYKNDLLLTGGSGFLGKNIKDYLSSYYSIRTLGLANTNDLQMNLAKDVPDLDKRYGVVLHTAGKAHLIPKTEADKKAFFDVNFQGTKNLCAALEKIGVPNSFIFISTVSVYGIEKGEMIKETHTLKAIDSYGLSKIKAEDFLLEWGAKHSIKIIIIRLPLIIGHDSTGNLKTMIKGIRTGFYFNINGGLAKRSMVLANDIANFIPTIVEYEGIFHLTDGHHPSFGELSNVISSKFGKKKILNIPITIAYIIAKIADFAQKLFLKEFPFNSNKMKKMTSSLTFDDSKARDIGWQSKSIITNSHLWF
jgi:nucleoside-diphosphate-sugar epimerase